METSVYYNVSSNPDFVFDSGDPYETFNRWEIEYDELAEKYLPILMEGHNQIVGTVNRIIAFRIEHIAEAWKEFDLQQQRKSVMDVLTSASRSFLNLLDLNQFLNFYVDKKLPKNHYLVQCFGERYPGYDFNEKAVRRDPGIALKKRFYPSDSDFFNCEPDYDLNSYTLTQKDLEKNSFDEKKFQDLINQANLIKDEKCLNDHSKLFTQINNQLILRALKNKELRQEFLPAVAKIVIKNAYNDIDEFQSAVMDIEDPANGFSDDALLASCYEVPYDQIVKRFLLTPKGEKVSLGSIEVPNFFIPSKIYLYRLPKERKRQSLFFLDNQRIDKMSWARPIPEDLRASL